MDSLNVIIAMFFLVSGSRTHPHRFGGIASGRRVIAIRLNAYPLLASSIHFLPNRRRSALGMLIP